MGTKGKKMSDAQKALLSKKAKERHAAKKAKAEALQDKPSTAYMQEQVKSLQEPSEWNSESVTALAKNMKAGQHRVLFITANTPTSIAMYNDVLTKLIGTPKVVGQSQYTAIHIEGKYKIAWICKNKITAGVKKLYDRVIDLNE